MSGISPRNLLIDYYPSIVCGNHIIAELVGCDPNIIEDQNKMETILSFAAEKLGSKVISIQGHKFKPIGLTLVALLAFSHISIHTWPEYRYVAIDVFTCGEANPEQALDYLIKILSPKRVTSMKIKRGVC